MNLFPNLQKGKQKKFLAKENTFQLDAEHSFKTLNKKPGAYERSPGAAVLHLGGRNKPEAVECRGDEDDDISVVSAASGLSTRSKNLFLQGSSCSRR